MSAPVDVMAYLQALEREIPGSQQFSSRREEAKEARAALAELIEADKEYDAAFDARIGAHWLENNSRQLFNAAAKRRAAALARVQGGGA